VGTVSETIKVSARSVILNTDDVTLGNTWRSRGWQQ
jgi:hypothetical protein